MTDLASETTKEALSNIRDLMQVRDEPGEYGAAYTDFVQKQTDLFTRTGQAFADETQKAGGRTANLASEASEEMTSKVVANAESAARTARAAAKKAA